MLLPTAPVRSRLRGILKRPGRKPVTIREMDEGGIAERRNGETRPPQQAAMIGLDTNILIRHITQDDPAQSPRASALIEGRLTEDEPGFVSIVTLAETHVWVLQIACTSEAHWIRSLRSSKGFSRSPPSDRRERGGGLPGDDHTVQEGRGSFTDLLIAALGRKGGLLHNATFDRKAARLPRFRPA